MPGGVWPPTSMGPTMPIGKLAFDPYAWEVTDTLVPFKNDKDEVIGKVVKANAKAKNALFEAITKDIFAQVKSASTAHEIWKQNREVHEGSSDVKEDRYYVLKNKYDSFTMSSHELINETYSHLNLIVEDINSLGVKDKIDDGDLVRKIMRILPREKYGSLITCLFNSPIEGLTTHKLLGKIAAFESYNLDKMIDEKPTKNLAFMLENSSKKNGKKVVSQMSSDDEEEEVDEEEVLQIHPDDLALLMRRRKFFTRRSKKEMVCYNCQEKGHFAKECTKPPKKVKKKTQDSSEDEDEEPRVKYKKKKKFVKKDNSKGKEKKKTSRRGLLAQDWVTDEDSSDKDDEGDGDSSSKDKYVAGIVLTNITKDIPPPPM